jgi:hypothetical protein
LSTCTEGQQLKKSVVIFIQRKYPCVIWLAFVPRWIIEYSGRQNSIKACSARFANTVRCSDLSDVIPALEGITSRVNVSSCRQVKLTRGPSVTCNDCLHVAALGAFSWYTFLIVTSILYFYPAYCATLEHPTTHSPVEKYHSILRPFATTSELMVGLLVCVRAFAPLLAVQPRIAISIFYPHLCIQFRRRKN